MADLFEEHFGINGEEILKWHEEGRKNLVAENGRVTRENLSKKFPEAAIRSAEELGRATALFSDAGYAMAIVWLRELQEKKVKEAREILEGTLDRLYTNPVFLKDRALWVLAQVLLRSQQTFTSKSCSAPTLEQTLSGALLGAIAAYASVWAEKGEKLLQQANAKLQIGSIDLQINRREATTGGDFGLIVEYERNNVVFYLPLIFQAKRYHGATADVSQFHDTRGYQYVTLNNQKCAAAYLFYHNGQDTIKDNVPPLAKLVQAIAHPDIKSHTEVGDETYDFFSFMMKAIVGGASFPTATNERDALSMIISTAPPEQLIAIVALGRSDDTQARFQSAYDSIEKGHDPDDDANQDESMTKIDRTPKMH